MIAFWLATGGPRGRLSAAEDVMNDLAWKAIRAIDLASFVRESNRIEGIVRDPTASEIRAHEDFLSTPPTVTALVEFVQVVQPEACLRSIRGLDVMVGRYFPPPGGPEIEETLIKILDEAYDPYLTHQAYEYLHPFTDGNGRSGRVLWLSMMGGIARTPLGFLHHWYYQSLQNYCRVSS